MTSRSFIFGPGQKAETPEDLKRLRAFAASLLGPQRAPQNVGEGLTAIGQAIAGRIAMSRANSAEAAGRASGASAANPILAALGGGATSPYVPPTSNKVADALGAKKPKPNGSGTLPSRFDFANAEQAGKAGGSVYASFMDEVKKGLTNPHGLAAVAATGKAESSWSPTNVAGTWNDPSQSGKAGTAGGALSWRNERLAALQNFARENGGDPTDPAVQARFFIQEDPDLITGLQNAKSVEDAQGLINNAWKFGGYDKPGGESARRLAYAQEYLPTFGSGAGTDAMAGSSGPDRMAPAGGILSYANEGAIRNQPLVAGLESNLQDAVSSVYGPGYSVQVYSGGQAGKGEKGRRTGSVRHDHGRAGDVYVVDPNGKRVTGDALAPLGQYWAAKKYGGVGLEMHGGGIHLDNWATPPSGGGMHWNYADDGGSYTPGMRAAMEAGLRGELPKGYQPPMIAGGGTDELGGGAGADTLTARPDMATTAAVPPAAERIAAVMPAPAPQPIPAPQMQDIAPSRFDGPGSMGDPGVQAFLAQQRGQQGDQPGFLQSVQQAFGISPAAAAPQATPAPQGGVPAPAAPSAAPEPQLAQAGPQPAGNGPDALSLPNLMQALENPWLPEGTRALILSEIQRQQQVNDPAYQLELEKQRAELDALRNPKPGSDWAKLDDGSLFNQRTGEVRKVGEAASKPPNIVELYDDQTGQPYKAQWNEKSRQYERVGGIKAPTGTQLSVDPTTGAVTFQQGSGLKPLTENQSKLTLFQSLQTETQPVLLDLEKQFDPANIQDAAARSAPIAGNFFQSEQGQIYQAAATAWAEGALRIATGAAATPEEMERTKKAYFAQVGDTPNTIAFKAQMREMYNRAINRSLGKQADGSLPKPSEFAKQFASGSNVAPKAPVVIDGYTFEEVE